jgi:hypothetical protein
MSIARKKNEMPTNLLPYKYLPGITGNYEVPIGASILLLKNAHHPPPPNFSKEIFHLATSPPNARKI